MHETLIDLRNSTKAREEITDILKIRLTGLVTHHGK